VSVTGHALWVQAAIFQCFEQRTARLTVVLAVAEAALAD
jgi:hypothetical protein